MLAQKVLELFLAEFFPQIQDRLMLVNLSGELKQKDRRSEGFLHTYDYLKYVQTKINQETTELYVCLGIDAQNSIKQNSFNKEEEIKSEFKVFYLTEEKKIKSKEIRKFLNDKKIIKSKKDESAMVQYLGHHVSKYIIDKCLYGIINKQIEYNNKKLPETVKEKENELEQKNILNRKIKI